MAGLSRVGKGCDLEDVSVTFHVPVEEGKTNFAVLEAVSDHFVEFELYQNLYCLLSLWMCVCV